MNINNYEKNRSILILPYINKLNEYINILDQCKNSQSDIDNFKVMLNDLRKRNSKI